MHSGSAGGAALPGRTTKETAAAGGVTTRDVRYQGDSIVEELTNGTITRDYVVDASGRTVKVIVPVGQTDAGTYLVTWNAMATPWPCGVRTPTAP